MRLRKSDKRRCTPMCSTFSSCRTRPACKAAKHSVFTGDTPRVERTHGYNPPRYPKRRSNTADAQHSVLACCVGLFRAGGGMAKLSHLVQHKNLLKTCELLSRDGRDSHFIRQHGVQHRVRLRMERAKARNTSFAKTRKGKKYPIQGGSIKNGSQFADHLPRHVRSPRCAATAHAPDHATTPET